jgi:cytochrome b561
MSAPASPLTDDPQDGGLQRYSRLFMVLHWTIALLIFVEIGLGWYFNEAMVDHSPAQDRVQDIHSALGLTTLLLILVRVVLRFAVRVPALPRDLPRWEAGLAHVVHVLLYVLMFALPLSGWLLLTVRHAPIPFWGIDWPALPGLEAYSGRAHRAFGQAAKHLHIFTMIWIALVLIGLHVAGAIKHQFDGHPVLWRMAPFLRPRG